MSNPRKAFESAIKRKAILTEGPVGRVLDKVWNDIHDIEDALMGTVRPYDNAASYLDRPARRDAEAMIRMIKGAVKELERVSMKTFGQLADAERKFVKEFGDPDEYADQMSREIFPL